MTQVNARPGESIDSLIRRFKKAVDNAGILADTRKHEYFEKPSIQKKRKKAAAKKRSQKTLRIKERYMKSGQNFKYNHDKTQKIPIQPPKKPFVAKRRPYDRHEQWPKLMPRDNNQPNRRS
jgi:small subunit ribosomal protein S21